MRVFWISLGAVSVVFGVAGIFLPLLPTTPFLLLAAYSFSRGSERLHRWLVEHPHLGPPIHNWQTDRTIARPVKVSASLLMGATFVGTLWWGAPNWALACQGTIFLIVGIFLWRQKEPTPSTAR